MNWTEEEYQEYLQRRGAKTVRDKPKKAKKAKYRNIGTWQDGFYFRSQLELNRYLELKLLFKAGEIAGFILQPCFILQEGNENNKGITYTADFLILNNDGTYTIEDTKGYESQQWRRTYKQFKLRYPRLELKVVK